LKKGSGCTVKAKAVGAGCPFFKKETGCPAFFKGDGCPLKTMVRTLAYDLAFYLVGLLTCIHPSSHVPTAESIDQAFKNTFGSFLRL
jgi:hypothetical protein